MMPRLACRRVPGCVCMLRSASCGWHAAWCCCNRSAPQGFMARPSLLWTLGWLLTSGFLGVHVHVGACCLWLACRQVLLVGLSCPWMPGDGAQPACRRVLCLYICIYGWDRLLAGCTSMFPACVRRCAAAPRPLPHAAGRPLGCSPSIEPSCPWSSLMLCLANRLAGFPARPPFTVTCSAHGWRAVCVPQAVVPMVCTAGSW